MFEVIAHETWDARERRILAFWQEKGIFERSVKERADAPLFVTYDGPPFATGLPHYGHLLAGTIKDAVLRFKTMEGYYVPRRFGWDCHGLPIEQEVEKAQGLSGAASIEAFGIPAFNEACRSIVKRYTEEWKTTVHRAGRWVDFSQTYHTMDITFMESVWWVFKQLYDQGLVYEGYRVMPYSAKLGTPLSNFEAGENYKEVDDPSLTVALQMEDSDNTWLLIWTTTPWTLPSNLAVMVAPDIEYVTVKDEETGRNYILAAARLSAIFGERPHTIIETCRGSDLVGRHYRPLFNYFAEKRTENAFRVILEESVSVDDGTGIVHAAPAFGEVDFYACQRAGLPLVCPVDANGCFTADIPEYTGIFVKDADAALIRSLKERGHLFRQATIHHRYPFCYRSDTPLIYRAMSTWFVAVERLKERLLAANAQIHWVPGHIQEGRFGKWLEGARDWNISRNRYWGTPLPLWRAEDGECIAVGSIAELQALTGEAPEDLHRHYIDHITITRNGKVYRRVPEVFDCWFESGSMPYAQNHYPFENKELFDNAFPADFIAEGLDQTRGWFYTLTVLAAALFDKPAFKNVIVNGIVLAEDGAKMSKRLRNYPDPNAVISHYGADAVRLYMLHSPAVRAENLCFTESGVELVLRQVLIPFWHAYSFLATYAAINGWQPADDAPPPLPQNILDKWLLARVNGLIGDVRAGMDDYVLSRAVEPLVGFIDALTNWYIRRSRRRFWEAEDSQDRSEAFSTLYYTLLQLCKVAAPFIPFLADAIYTQLASSTMPSSVHLTDYPARHTAFDNTFLEKAMDVLQQAVSLGHGLRKEQKIKVRQPLPHCQIICHDPLLNVFLSEHGALIADELNVKVVTVSEDDSAYVEYSIKPNFRVLGKKVGKGMRAAQEAIAAFTPQQVEALLGGQEVTIELAGESYAIGVADVEIARTTLPHCVAATTGPLTVVLDTTMTPELLMEGLAREVVNKINTMRREAGFAVTDRISVRIATTPRVEECWSHYGDYINGEILATEVSYGSCPGGTAWTLNGEPAIIAIQRS
jgi:isoleucyl-tRNA synthetase